MREQASDRDREGSMLSMGFKEAWGRILLRDIWGGGQDREVVQKTKKEGQERA